MSLSDSDARMEFIGALGEEFVERFRRGDRPALREYTEKYPQYAHDIEELFPALVMMEDLAPQDRESQGLAADRSAAKLPELDQLGDFRIIREVGRGGMGVVYEAEQVSLGRHVALKVLPAAALPDNKHVRRFEREARSAAKLHHTNIVPVFGVGEQDEMHYYVMQFIQGLPLDEVIDELKKIQAQPTGAITSSVPVERTGSMQRQQSVAEVAHSLMTGQFAATQIGDSDSGVESPAMAPTETNPKAATGDSSSSVISETLNLSGSLSDSTMKLGKSGVQSAPGKTMTYWQSVAHIGAQVADALHYAHEQGILHRDIKPSNLLLDLRGTTWVTDFGLAKATDQQDITHTGDILGTLRYMPPEAFDGNADARSDVYSLGLTLYELLAFQPAFGLKERHQLIKQVTSESAPRLDKLNPQIPRDLVTIVHKAIDRDPSHRYQTAEELREDLHRFIEDEPIKARRISLTERLARWSRRNKGLAASLGTIAVLLLIINIAGPLMYLQAVRSGKDAEAAKIELEKEKGISDQQAKDNKDLAEEAQLSVDILSMNQAYRLLTTPGWYAYGKKLLEKLRQASEKNQWGFAYHLLNSLPDPNAARILYRNSKSVRNAAHSPDGRYLAVAEDQGSIRVLDSITGSVVRQFSSIQRFIRELVWSPDGSQLAYIVGDTIWILHLQTGLERSIRAESTLRGIAWSPDGISLATGGSTGLVLIWDARTGQRLETWSGHEGDVYDVDWSSDDRLASCGNDGRVLLWDLKTGQATSLQKDGDELNNRFNHLNFSPDGSLLAASGGIDVPVVIWNMHNRDEVHQLPVTGYINDLKWSRDGTRLAAASYVTSSVDIWDVETEQRPQQFKVQAAGFLTCSWGPDDQQIAASGRNGNVYVWDVIQQEPSQAFISHQSMIRDLAWSPGGRYFATAGGVKGRVCIWDARSKRKRFEFENHDSYVRGIDWHPHKNRLVSFDSRSATIWDWDGGINAQVIQKIDGILSDEITGYIYDIAWSPDGTKLAMAVRASNEKQDGFVRIYQVNNEPPDAGQSEELLKEYDEFSLKNAYSISWDSRGSLLAAAGENEIIVRNVNDRTTILSHTDASQSFRHVALSPHGDRVAFSGASSSNRFADSGSTKPVLGILDRNSHEIEHLTGHEANVSAISWTSDGTRMTTAAADGTAILWDAESGRLLLTFYEPSGSLIIAARFSPDDLQLALAGMSPRIWMMDSTPSHVDLLSDKLLYGLAYRIPEVAANDDVEIFDDLVLRGRIYAKRGELGLAKADFERAAKIGSRNGTSPTWFETNWWVATGSYPKSLTRQQPPERQTDPALPIPSSDAGGKPSHWRFAPISSSLDLGQYFAGASDISAYAMTYVYSTQLQDVGLLLGADDLVRVWQDRELIHSREQELVAVRDGEVVELTLKPGWNKLLFKVVNHTGPHGLFARLSQNPIDLASAYERAENWEKARHWWGIAVTELPDDVPILLSLGHASLKAAERQIVAESFDRALNLLDDKIAGQRRIASWYLEDARSLIFSESSPDAADSLARARQLYEQLLNSEFPAADDAAGMAEVLLTADLMSSRWQVLHPIKLESSGGATLMPLDDGSIRVSGALPEHDTYTVEATLPTDRRLSVLQILALPDASLPHEGPGRHSSGNFHLTEIELQRFTPGADESAEPVQLDRAIASYEQTNNQGSWRAAVSGTIDGDVHRNPWAVQGQLGVAHEAVYRVANPVTLAANERLRLRLHFQDKKWKSTSLGRFRLSVSGDPRAFERETLRLAGVANGWERLALAYHLSGDESALASLLDRRPEAAVGIISFYVDSAKWTEAMAWLNQIAGAIDTETVERLGKLSASADHWEDGAAMLGLLLDRQLDTDAPPEQRAVTRRYRGALYVRAGKWREAADDYATSAKLNPAADSGDWMKPAALYAYVGDAKEHHNVCEEMWKHFSTSTRPEYAERTLKMMLMMEPGFEAELDAEKWPVQPLLKSLGKEAGEFPFRRYFVLTRALLAYRSDKFGGLEEAQKWDDEWQQRYANQNLPPVWPLFEKTIRTLILTKQGDTQNAQRLLDDIKLTMQTETQIKMKWRNDGSLDGISQDSLTNALLNIEILRREAERLLQVKTEEAPTTKQKPADTAKP